MHNLVAMLLESTDLRWLLDNFDLIKIVCYDYLDGVAEIILKQSNGWRNQHAAGRLLATNWSFQAGFVAATVFSCVLVMCYTSMEKNRPSQASLQAISSVLTPTGCAWPNDYASLLKHARCKRNKSLNISFSMLLRSLCVGSVELRNYGDIPGILRGQFRLYDWTVLIAPDSCLWIRVIRWTVLSQVPSLWYPRHSVQKYECMRIAVSSCPSGHHQATSSTKKHLDHTTKGANFTCTQTCSLISLPQLGGSYKNNTVSIDEIPYPHLKSSIHHIIRFLPKGTALSFQFTTLAPDIAYLSETFMICAIPFLPRIFPAVPSHEDRVRTSTPLLASLHQVIDYLSSASAAANIESMVDISQAYTKTLYSGIKDLTTVTDCRQACIDKYGHKGWREQQFLMAWEAGLLVARHLIRWHVVVVRHA